MKKTLFILPSLAGGGAERVCINLVNELSLNDLADLVVISQEGELLGLEPSNTFFLTGSIFSKLLQLRKLSKNYQVIVGALELKGYIWAWLASLNQNISLKLWLHKDLIGYFSYTPKLKKILYKTSLNMVLYRADKLVCVSKEALKNFKALYPNFASKATYCYNPMNFSSVNNLSNALPSDNIHQDYFIAVGRLEQQKGFDYLIDAYKKAYEVGMTTPLYILGDGSLKSSLQLKIDSLGLNESVFLLGFVPPYPYIKSAKALLLTSRMEALPTVLVEAAFLQTPFIAFDCHSGPKEIREYFKIGTVVENRNVQAFSDAMCAFSESLEHKVVEQDKFDIFSQEYASKCWEKVLQ